MKCNIPPAGWACTRKAGHDGPCAAIQLGGDTEPTTDIRPRLPKFKQLIMAPYRCEPNQPGGLEGSTFIALAALDEDGLVWRWDPLDQTWTAWPMNFKVE